MALCEKLIKTCIAADCDNPIFTGVGATAYIFNKSEFLEPAYDATNSNIITAFNLATGTGGTNTKGYVVSQLGKTPFTGSTVSMVEGNSGNKFTNTISIVVPDNSPLVANGVLDNLANGKFVVVLRNDYDGSDHKGRFQVFGVKKGLVATAIENDKYSEDTNGGWAVTLTEEGSPKSAYFLVHTTDGDVDDTETYLASITDDCAE